MKIIDYIQGKRRGKEANKLEREAMNDPFLQDAIDGFDAVQGDHVQAIHELENKINQKTGKRKSFISYRLWAISAAASVVFILGIGSLLHFYALQPDNTAVQVTKTVVLPEKDSTKAIEYIKVSSKKLVAEHIDKQMLKYLTKRDVEPVDAEQATVQETAQPLAETNTNISVADVGVDIADVRSLNSVESKQPDTDKVYREATTKSSLVQQGVASARWSTQITDVKIPTHSTFGKVVDINGKPIIGAIVKVKGLDNGTVTNTEGRFELSTPINNSDKLVAYFVGYENKEVSISRDSNIIQMNPSNLALSEVVVVGYGLKKMTLTTGAVSNAMVIPNVFGENEFIQYYKNHRKAELCNVQKYVLKVSFRIDNSGSPIQIKIRKAPCADREHEFIKMLEDSPKWSKRNRNVSLTIRM